eukprot:554707_1
MSMKERSQVANTSNENNINFTLIQIISTISQQKNNCRDKGLKLMHKIINNILSNPQEPKYRHLNVARLSEKLINNKIWIDLLLIAGFNKTKNGKALEFDVSKIEQLKHVHTALNNYAQNKIDHIKTQKQVNNTDHEQQRKSKLTNTERKPIKLKVACICGQHLINSEASSLPGAYCDVCQKTKKDTAVFWHCQNGRQDLHRFGFDICDHCITEYVQEILPNYLEQKGEFSLEKCAPVIQQKVACETVSKCCHVRRLIHVIQEYNRANLKLDSINILQTINDYSHIQCEHKTEQHFEYIVKEMMECDIGNC